MRAERGVAESAGQVWFKSSYSGSSGGDCVEVAQSTSSVYVRDTKDRQGAALSVPSSQWSAFVAFATERDR